MEWFRVAFMVLWTFSAGAMALSVLRATRRWDSQGFVNNGLGTTISKSANPAMFRAMIVGLRCWCGIASVFAAFGAVATCFTLRNALT